ncbi:sialin-like [Odontomachus brunneus]|uniref:sialin-like n=1 Tax=Odontomachus brunneus TaxID=486640 RepID=UPI0013F29560|nr:sialin-like [Odontomachus brunneus]XP_032682801.1 sialin-like [Odontomachus brunneus]XP_032682802.1 sialin-like [Odontomachus brunneus]XP_032682803.1 sialin-like [Odontomachus brunneus]XP_032682804.1 sialin-like [Odontomachus brunneus]XP_032682805.1 sialin-like [Odontomachus brunneus]XP_032682806.1 sialin-like [Odontomachus brunneus]XP_032682808.1 sialin-like [Odontomachus brunneus]XP_032682809.1 sialin-like [Odontomachus brunneus]
MAGYVRFLFALMLCVANMIIYGLKVNIATAIIGMVKKKPGISDWSDECPEYEPDADVVTDIDGPFDWSSRDQGLVVSIYFAGYLVGMFPAGYCADRFNTKIVLLICVLGNAFLTILVPITANVLSALYVVRFFTGVVSSANLPIVNVLVGKWVIYEEKSMWVGIIYAGTSLGTVISILTSGMILNYLGWEAIFYIHGVLPLIWCVVFYIFFEDSPEEQKYITDEERSLIVNSYGHRSPGSMKMKIPWKSIFTSVPFWALIATNTLGNFCWYFLLTQMPLYMNKILRFDIRANALITCTPYFVNAFTNPLLGKTLDWGRQKGLWTQTIARKIAVFISCIPPSIFLIIIAYIGCARVTSTVLLTLSIVVCGAIFVGHLTNQNDLAPNYAGILMGITNTPGTISAFILPPIVGALVEQGHTMARWRYVFWITVVAQVLAFFIFATFGSAKIQQWNYPPADVEDWDAEEQQQQPRQQETKT